MYCRIKLGLKILEISISLNSRSREGLKKIREAILRKKVRYKSILILMK